jgi:hypothetical protein
MVSLGAVLKLRFDSGRCADLMASHGATFMTTPPGAM